MTNHKHLLFVPGIIQIGTRILWAPHSRVCVQQRHGRVREGINVMQECGGGNKVLTLLGATGQGGLKELAPDQVLNEGRNLLGCH